MTSLRKPRRKPRPQRNPEPVREYMKTLTTKDPTREEWLAHCRRAANDFTYFAEYMCGMRVHPGQIDVVRLMNEKQYGVLAAANRWGKTLAMALIDLWATFGKRWSPPGWQTYRSVVLGPEMKQALLTHAEIDAIRNNRHEGQLWDGVEHKFRLAPWLIPFKTGDTHLAYKWKHNGALLHFESADNKATSIEGWRPNLIFYDEARLELYLDFIVNNVLIARGASTPGMRIALVSTPLASSFELLEFFKRGERGEQDWWSRRGRIAENIFLSAETVEQTRRNLDPRVRDQVMNGEWVEPPDAYFISDRVNECMDPGVTPVDITSYLGKFSRNHQYIAGLDAAVAEGGDETVVTMWDIFEVPYRVVLEKAFPKGTPLTTAVGFCDILIRDFSAVIGYDATGPLGVELSHQVSYDPASYIPIKFSGGQRGGTSAQKAEIMANFRHFVNNKLWWAPNLPELRAQLISYQVKDQHLNKDRLMAQVYAAWVAKDYLSDTSQGLTLKAGGNPYAGEGVSFERSVPKDWENKSALQRKWLVLSQQHEQREARMRATQEQ